MALADTDTTPRCIFDNATIDLNLRDGSMSLLVWPDPDRLDECADYTGDLTVLLDTTFIEDAKGLFKDSSLMEPRTFTLQCPKAQPEDCTELFQSISTCSFTISRQDSSAGTVSLNHYANAVSILNFEYDDCWALNALYYSRGTLPVPTDDGGLVDPIQGICLVVTPQKCKFPKKVEVYFHFYGDGDVMETFHINGTDGQEAPGRYNYNESRDEHYDYGTIYRYCYNCDKGMFQGETDEKRKEHVLYCQERMDAIMASDTLHVVMEVVAIPEKSDNTLDVPFYARTYSQSYESYRFPGCFSSGELFLYDNRLALSVSLNPKAKEGTCAFPDGVSDYYMTVFVDVYTNERDPNNSEFFYRMTHRVTDFDFARNRYWFLCNGDNACLNAITKMKTYRANASLFVRSGVLVFERPEGSTTTSLAEMTYVDEVSFNVPPEKVKLACFGTSSAQFTTNGLIINIFPNEERVCPHMLNQDAAYIDVVLSLNEFDTLEQVSKTPYGHFAIEGIPFTLGDVITVTCDNWLSEDDDPDMAGLDCNKQLSDAAAHVKSHHMIVEVGIYEDKDEVGNAYDHMTSINTVYWQNLQGLYIGLGVCMGVLAVASVAWATVQILKYKRTAVMDR